MKKEKISVALIGCGYWGKKLFRVLLTHKDFSFHHCVDVSFKNSNDLKEKKDSIQYETNPKNIFFDSSIDAVIIATPFKTHYSLVKEALKSKKHVLVEKPMVENEKEAKELILLAKKEQKIIMVDHTFLFDDAILLMKKYIQSSAFGSFEALYTIREQYGPFRKGESVIWDLGIHDVSIARFFFGEEPISLSSQYNHLTGSDTSVSSQFHLQFSKNRYAFVRVSWIAPEKRRELIVIGTKAIIRYDQCRPDTLFWYTRDHADLFKKEIIFSRKETLVSMLSHFASSISFKEEPRTNGKEGLAVIRILKKLDSL